VGGANDIYTNSALSECNKGLNVEYQWTFQNLLTGDTDNTGISSSKTIPSGTLSDFDMSGYIKVSMEIYFASSTTQTSSARIGQCSHIVNGVGSSDMTLAVLGASPTGFYNRYIDN